MSKNDKIKIFLIFIIFTVSSIFLWMDYNNQKIEDELEKERIIKEKISDINNHYNKYVKTIEETNLYVLDGNEYVESGKIGEEIELELSDIEITSDTNYFSINGFNKEYFIEYTNVSPIDNLSKLDERYKHYILFNENVLTKETTRFYKDEKLVYELNESFNLPIIIKDNNKIYVEYQNQLLYVLSDEIEEIIANNNTDKVVAKEIPTIVYHFIYNPETEECNQIICHTINQVQSHIDYLKSENYFTPTMKEFEMFIDGKLLLPKNSIVITIDDGWFGGNARDIFTKNEMNATIFVITSGYDASSFVTDYVEVHSHSDNLHTQGVCPGGQGGAIKCADKSMLLEDLRLSREKTFNSTVFCYPFYEYNEYAISVLKEAGFTMAFAGEYAGGHRKMPVGGDKYRIPRFTLLSDATIAELKEFLNS